MTKNQLAEYLRELHLPTVRQCYQNSAIQAQNESLSYEQFLFEIIEKEVIDRRNNKVERLLKQSKLPLEKNLGSFDLKRLPQPIIQQLNVLLEGSFLDRQENLLIFGNSGSGKTHAVSALAQELVRKGRSVYFSSASLLVQELLIAKQNLKLARLLKTFSRYDAIIIDDLGYVQYEADEMEVLFTLFAERYERGSLMITSNLPFSKWNRIFKNDAITVATTDRMIHHSIIIEMNLPSYRIEHAKKEKELRSA
jgi:DNA replication protein DnaC